jgi:hypothetical protein
MTEIEEKLAGIKGMVNDGEIEIIKAKMQDPDRIICPLNKRYAQLPFVCTGYQYVCMYLNRAQIACNHPEKREWQVTYASPTLKILTR